MSGSLQQGSIVWVTVQDQQERNPKRRPVVVVTATSEITPGGVVVLVAVTTQVGTVPAGEAVPLPWHAGGHPRTRFRRPCVAVCDWRITAPVDDLPPPEGVVPARQLAEILVHLSPPPPPAE